MNLVAGLDIGNGYVKGSIEGVNITNVDMPSGVAYVTNTHDIKTKLSDADDVIQDLYNQLDVSVDSPLVRDKTRRLFGHRGIASGNVLDEFDVSSHKSKAKQDLSAVLVLGCLAGKALQDYWTEHHALPTDMIQVTTRVALALPIGEYKEYRKMYADGFKSDKHLVSIHNFEQIIRVEIVFEDVQVTAEGASAQYAITAKGEPLMNAMLSEARKMGLRISDEITAKDVLGAMNTIGIDIGEGTVNYPVFQDGRFNPDSSATLNKGYGSVLNNALVRLEQAGYAFNSRKALADFLQTTPSAMSRPRYNKVKHIVDEEAVAFSKEVTREFVKVLSKVGAFTEVIYVYGGGATPMKSNLYPDLLNAVEDFGDADAVYPILYLDSRYSRFLNREGLFTIADGYAKSVATSQAKSDKK